MSKKTAEEIKKMKEEELAKYIAEMSRKLDSLEKSTYEISGFGKTETGLRTSEQLSQMNDTLRQIIFSGAQFARGGALEAGLLNTIQLMQKLTGSTKIGADAYQNLSTNFEQFGRLAELQKDQVGNISNFTEKLAAQAGVLKEFGLGMSEFNSNMELSINLFGQTADEVSKLNTGLVEFAKEIKMMPSVVSRNFQLVAQSIMYDGQKVQQQFANFQEMSAKTGVRIGTLVSSFGSPMDTIGGASSMAGKLNAVLGTRFSGNQLLMMDEDDRMALIRQAIRDNAFISGEIEKGSKIGKFALNSVSSILNMSPPEAKRFITTGKLKRDLADATGRDFDAATLKRGDGSGDRMAFSKGVSDMTTELQKYTTMLKDVALSVKDRAMVEEMARYMHGGPAAISAGGTPTVSAAAIEYMQRQFTTEFDAVDPAAELNKILNTGKTGTAAETFEKNAAEAMILVPRLLDLTRKVATLPMDDAKNKAFAKKVKDMIDAAAGATTAEAIIRIGKDAAQLAADSEESMPFNFELDDEVDPFEQELLKSIVDDTATFNKQIRLFRSKGVKLGNLNSEERAELDLNDDGTIKDTQRNKELLTKAGVANPASTGVLKKPPKKPMTPKVKPKPVAPTPPPPDKDDGGGGSGGTGGTGGTGGSGGSGGGGGSASLRRQLEVFFANYIMIQKGKTIQADMTVNGKKFAKVVELALKEVV